MKIFKKKGKSFTGLFIKTFFVSIIAVVISIMFCVGLIYNRFWGFVADKFYTDKEMALYGANVLPNDFKDLDKEKVLNNNGWIEVLKNNEVVDVIGDKKDDMEIYSSNLISYMNESGVIYFGSTIEPINSEYTVKVYDEELKYTYLVKIPRFDIVLNNYIDRVMELDEEDKEFEEFVEITKDVIYMPILIGFIIFILIMGIHIFLSIRSIKKPLAKIENGIDEFSSGNMEAKIDFYSYSELNKIKENFNYMIDKVDKAEKERLRSEESKKNMIRDISHDIKTPITSILGYSKAIIDKERMSEKERDTYLQYIYNKTTRIDYLINELFKFVELDSKNYNLHKIERDYMDFVREVVLLHYKDIEDKNFKLELDLDEKVVLLNFDHNNMERALSNLIINAIKYNDEGTKLKISVKEYENEIVTIVEDDGIGMEDYVCERLFDEFVRGDKDRNSKGGSGLGLSITKKIVELHLGSINLESELGEGSKFTIKLPK